MLITGLTTNSLNAQGSWTLQTNPIGSGETAMLGKVQFVTETEGWISASNSGGLLHTTNAGITWSLVPTSGIDIVTSSSDPFGGLSFISPTTGWVMKMFGDINNPLGAVVYKTTDKGVTWQQQLISETVGDGGFQLQFFDANNGWASVINFPGSIKYYKTTNGGSSWNLISTDTSWKICHFIDANNGWAIDPWFFNQSTSSKIYRTTNGGASWVMQYEDLLSMQFHAIQFTDINNGWVVGENGKILKTTNGGTNWFPLTNVGISTEYFNNCLYFKNATTGWIGSRHNNTEESAKILHTNDGGISWTTQDTNYPNGNIFSIYFGDDNNGWFTGDSGVIGHYSAVNTYPSIGIVGDATSDWDTDIAMNTTDGITYTITAYTFKNGGAKFRQDNAWAINWGSNAFPAGTGTQNGPNIPVIAGTYNVTFNRTTGAYNFANPLNTDWVQQTSGTTNSLKSVFFTDDNNGYIVGGGQMGQVILKTTNGGTNWISKNSFTPYTLNSVFSTDANTTYCVGGDGSPNQTLLKTTNGGSNWSTLTGSGVIELKSVFFVDSNIGYAVGGGNNQGQHIILKTINGGTSWVTQIGTTSPNDLTFYSVFFTDANTGYIVGESGIWGTILKTTDGGINWIQQNSGSHSHLNSVFFIDSNVGYIVGDSGVILKTINGGTNYTTQVSGTSRGLSSVYFLNADIGYAVGEFGTILKTTNGGVNWTIQPSGTTLNLNSVYFSYNVGYATGEGGIILKNNNGGLGKEGNIINKFITIFPNPNSGTFYFSLKDTNSKVKAEIYTLSGQKVYETSNFEIEPQNEINFAPQAKGIYLIKITDGENSYSEKIMIR